MRQRAAATGANHAFHSVSRRAASVVAFAVMRTSFAGDGVVVATNRWRARRPLLATDSSVSRSTLGRHVADHTGAAAKTTSSTSHGWIEPSSTSTNASRTSHPTVMKSEPNRWSRAKTWSRRTDRRSACSVRSKCSTVGTRACSSATWAWKTMPMRSRKRRSTRCKTTLSHHVAVAETANPPAATASLVVSWSTTASVRSLSHSASRASGSAPSTVRANEATRSFGSAR